MFNLKFEIKGQCIKLEYKPLAAGSIKYLTAAFSFSSDWDGMTKTLSFINGTHRIDRIITGDRITEEDNLQLAYHGTWIAGVTGVNSDGQRITTRPVKVYVGVQAPYISVEPTPEEITLYEQAVAASGEALRVAQSLRDDADAGRFIGPVGPKGDKGDRGEKGDTGAQGPKGDKGDTGPRGAKGDTGAQGLKGDKGDTGARGPQGVKGDKGDKGDTGETGPQGPQGERGPAGETVTAESIAAALGYTPADDADVTQLKEDIADYYEKTYDEFPCTFISAPAGWELVSSGLCKSNSNYTLVKYEAEPGKKYHVKTSALWQFQNSGTVPSSGKPNRVGETYSGEQTAVAPEGTICIVVSTPKTGEYSASVYESTVPFLRTDLGNLTDIVETECVCKNLVGDDGRLYRIRTLHTGDSITFSTSDGNKSVTTREICFYNSNKQYITYYSLGTSNSSRTIVIPESLDGACYVNLRGGSYGYEQKLQIEYGDKVTPYVEHFDNVRQLADLIEDKENTVPAFYREHMAQKEVTIRAVAETHNIADSFVFLTDYHDNSNSGNSHILVNSILNNTGVRAVVFGGDCINTTYEKDAAKKRLLAVRNAYANAENRFYIIGNHEYNDPNGTKTDKRLSASEIYSIMCGRQSLTYESTDGIDYSVVNKSAKIYYIMMGCTYTATISTAQMEWMCEELTRVPSGYAVMVISHTGLTDMASPKAANTDMVNALAAVKNKTSFVYNSKTYNYTNDVTVVGILSGHTHWDGAIISNGINVISTTCDAYNENYELVNGTKAKVARAIGTTDEHAFDVVQIDLANRQMILTRIGYGSDRLVSF